MHELTGSLFLITQLKKIHPLCCKIFMLHELLLQIFTVDFSAFVKILSPFSGLCVNCISLQFLDLLLKLQFGNFCEIIYNQLGTVFVNNKFANLMFEYLCFQDWWDGKLPESGIISCLSVIPKVLLAGVITLMDELYYKLAVWLNDKGRNFYC